MIRIFDFTHYKEFIVQWVASRPLKGRGEYLKMAKAMNMHSTQVSQVFKGNRDLSLEQGEVLCDYLELKQDEKKYFLDLINYERSGSEGLRAFYKKSLAQQKSEANRLNKRLKVVKSLTDAEMAIFYGDAVYSEVHLLTMIKEMNNATKIATRIKQNPKHVKEILSFLIHTGLVKVGPAGLEIGSTQTHVDSQSPFSLHHHRNWRLKAIQKQGSRSAKDLFYTGPMTLSDNDFEKAKEILRQALENIYKIIEPSPSENLFCLNFDFFEVDP